MKAFRIRRCRLALLLAGLPPFADVLGVRRIAHVKDHQNVAGEARIAGGEIGIFAARIGIAVGAGDAAHPRADLFGIFRIGNVPQQHRRQRVLLRGEAIERGDHQIVVQCHLRGEDALVVGLVGNEFHIARMGRVGDVDDAPALIKGMARVEIPPVVRGVLDGDLEGAVAPAERREADLLDVLGLRAGRKRIGKRALRREQRQEALSRQLDSTANSLSVKTHEFLPSLQRSNFCSMASRKNFGNSARSPSP